jgi:putative hydrolase of the HAD superfamily
MTTFYLTRLCFCSLLLISVAYVEALSISGNKIRVISLDVTGTMLVTRESVIKTYYDAAIWAGLPNPPSQDELKQGFKIGYKERCIESPCFGGVEGISGREWWKATVKSVLHYAGRTADTDYTPEEFDRYFRRVYQHFGSPAGYRVLEDAQSLISSLKSSDLLLGITSNTPTRYMESILPMLDGLHDNFRFFTCSQDVGHEKPDSEIFERSYQQAKFWIPDVKKEEILHIGDSYACDYCGAKAYGFQALLLDRSDNPSVTAYQTWLDAPDYPGKSIADVEENTITSLEEVATLMSSFSSELSTN